MVNQFFNLHFVHAITPTHISIIIQNEVEYKLFVCLYVFKINYEHRRGGEG